MKKPPNREVFFYRNILYLLISKQWAFIMFIHTKHCAVSHISYNRPIEIPPTRNQHVAMIEQLRPKESPTIEQEKRVCRELYDVVKKRDPEGLNSMGFYMGLALGVRSGTFLNKGLVKHAEEIQHTLSNHGVETLVSPSTGIIANKEALRQRLLADAAFAQSLGWGSATAEEAIQQTTPDSPNLNERTGFLLGFPTDSVRGYAEEESLHRLGVPWLYMPETADLPLWNNKERSVLQKLYPLFSRRLPLENEEMAMHHYHEMMKEREGLFGEVSNALMRNFPINRKQAHTLLSRQIVHANSPAANFAVFGYVTYTAADFASALTLRRKVIEKFNAVGW